LLGEFAITSSHTNASHHHFGTCCSRCGIPQKWRNPMKATRGLCSVAILVLVAPLLQAQAPPAPGPEFDVLKKMVGNWDLTMKVTGMEFKGSVTYKMELGGLWLASSLESELFGAKFSGK